MYYFLLSFENFVNNNIGIRRAVNFLKLILLNNKSTISPLKCLYKDQVYISGLYPRVKFRRECSYEY